MNSLTRIHLRIFEVRGHRVMLDYDLAELYGVPTKTLNQAVKRNSARFPGDFMMRLNIEEASSLRSQIVTLEKGRGRHRKYLPFAFTEQGIAMLSSVLKSETAIQVNIEIMRAFVRLKEETLAQGDLEKKVSALEKKYDSQFKVVFDAIREMIHPTSPTKRRIGI